MNFPGFANKGWLSATLTLFIHFRYETQNSLARLPSSYGAQEIRTKENESRICWYEYIEEWKYCTAFKYLHFQSDFEIWVLKCNFIFIPVVPIWLMFTFMYIQFICCSLNLDFRFYHFSFEAFLRGWYP